MKTNKEKLRQNCKELLKKNKDSFSIWSAAIFSHIENFLKPYSKIGSYVPMFGEPILPVSNKYLYPKILNSEDMTYGEVPELVLVPGLMFSQDGYRLGRGKGYFDRYLKKHPKVETLGVAYQIQVVDEASWPIDSWDKKLNFLMTENGRIL